LGDISDRKDEVDSETKNLANVLAKDFKGIIEFLEGVSEGLKLSRENNTALKAANKSEASERRLSDLITPQMVRLGFAQPMILLDADSVQSMSEVPLLRDNTETQEFRKLGAGVSQELGEMMAKLQQLDPSSSATPLASKVQTALAAAQKFATAAATPVTGQTTTTSYGSIVPTPITPTATPPASPLPTSSQTQSNRRW
jgi:hypothetical protein